MNNKTWHKASKVQEEPFKIKNHVSGGNNLIELGLKRGLAGEKAQFPEYLHYYTAWSLAWALEQLPEMTMHKLRQEWEYVKPKKLVNSEGIERESKAVAWFERIEDLKVVPF